LQALGETHIKAVTDDVKESDIPAGPVNLLDKLGRRASTE